MTVSHDASSFDGPRHVLPLRGPRQAASLEAVLTSIAADTTASRRQRRLPDVTITLDVLPSHAPAVDVESLRAGLASLVATACDAAAAPGHASDAPSLCEVVITVVDTPRGLEIEVANSGPGPEGLAASGLAATRGFAHQSGGSVRVASCPEGGAAVTLCLPSRRGDDRSVRSAA
jgi:signal transduction histidine kinase